MFNSFVLYIGPVMVSGTPFSSKDDFKTCLLLMALFIVVILTIFGNNFVFVILVLITVVFPLLFKSLALLLSNFVLFVIKLELFELYMM